MLLMTNRSFLLFISAFISLSLSSCKFADRIKDNSINSINESDTNSPLIFTEFHRGYDTNDRAVELYNKSEEDINLEEYTVCIYKQNETSPHITLKPKGILSSKKTYVIVYDQASTDLKALADFVTPDLMVDGSWPMSINKGNEIMDALGKIGYRYDYSINADIARKNEFFTGRTVMDDYDWIKYDADNISLLGKAEATMSEEELLRGQKLTEEDFAKPFIQDGVGGGGVIEVTLKYVGDGDTTTFNIPSESRFGYLSSSESVRYFGINTPEIQHGTSIDAQPWGTTAKKYNNNVLNNAKKFALQTVTGGAFRETYDRFLGFVWYSNVSNPKPEDYVCLNFEMVREALAFLYFAKVTDNRYMMFYKDVAYIHIMENAELRAKNNGWKIHGETDPNFNY